MQTEEENNETKILRKERRNCLRKCFCLFKYVIDHENLGFFFIFFFTNLLQVIKRLKQLHYFCTTCCIFYAHIASLLSQVYSHTNFVYKYMNPLKVIYEEEK